MLKKLNLKFAFSKVQTKDPKQYQDIISGKILEFLERAFPNKVSIEELAR